MEIKYWIAGAAVTASILTAVDAMAGNWNTQSSEPAPTYSSPSMFIDNEVWDKFRKSSPAQRAKYCPKDNKRAKHTLSLNWVPEAWPKKVEGFNSRMDNFRTVYGAKKLDDLARLLPGFVMISRANNWGGELYKAVEIVYGLAEQGAFLETKNCVNSQGMIAHCEMAWKRKDGQDLAPIKDYSTVQTNIVKIEWLYRAFLAEYATPAQSEVIDDYFAEFNKRQRPFDKLWFGLHMGYLWNAVADSSNPKRLLTGAIRDLDKMVYSDGSLKGRTNRGNRALWYHQDGLNATLVTMEMARRAGVEIPQSLIDNTEKAAEVWLRGYKDHSYMDKWAREGNMGVYTPGKQEYRKTANRQDSGNSWFYVFMYRYPNSPLVAEIQELLAGDFNNAIYDRKIGVGLGCIYGTALEYK